LPAFSAIAREFTGATHSESGPSPDWGCLSEDIAATVYTKLGIPLDLITRARDDRPIQLNHGKPIKEWM
jgi:hypothetical protein